jgi:23S rRNA pseudouridine1911/1915/1917 synthase
MPVDVMGIGDRHRLLAPGKSLFRLWHSELHTLTLHFTADRGDARLRLDQVLVRRVTGVSGMSRAQAQRWIAEGLVSVDETPAPRASIHVREGAAIEVMLPSTAKLREEPSPEPLPLDVVYEDDALMAINKPAGMVVHPSFRNPTGTVLNGILWRLRDRKDVRPGLVSRLDKDTSGLLIVALSPGAHARIQRDAHMGRVKKEYLAIVRGTPQPSEGVIRLPLRHDPADRRRIVVDDAGLTSETRYRVVSSGNGGSLVRCELVTGRTHQIRVHLAASGWPIVGDRIYGTPDPRIERQALHAWRITLLHPETRKQLSIEAPIAGEMRRLCMETQLINGTLSA